MNISQKIMFPPIATAEYPLEIGDRVRVAGLSQHIGIVTDIKNSPYSGLTYSVKIGGQTLQGVNPLALKPC